jgi:hypothetical protein
LASPSSFLAFLGGWENDRFPGGAAEAAPPTTRSPRRETLSFRPCQDLSWRLSWGFQRCPSIGLGARRPLLLGLASARASAPPRFGLSLPGDRSRSAFVVSHHLDGFLRRASCGFVAPRSRSWGSSRCGPLLRVAEATWRLGTFRGAPPFEASPRPQQSAVSPRFSRTPALLPFTITPSRLRERRWLDSRAFLHGTGSRVGR